MNQISGLMLAMKMSSQFSPLYTNPNHFFQEYNIDLRTFLVEDTQLNKRLCVSVHLSARPLIRLSRLSWKRYYSCFLSVCVGVCVCVWQGWFGLKLGWGWGLDAPAYSSIMILWPRITCWFKFSIPRPKMIKIANKNTTTASVSSIWVTPETIPDLIPNPTLTIPLTLTRYPLLCGWLLKTKGR